MCDCSSWRQLRLPPPMNSLVISTTAKAGLITDDDLVSHRLHACSPVSCTGTNRTHRGHHCSLNVPNLGCWVSPSMSDNQLVSYSFCGSCRSPSRWCVPFSIHCQQQRAMVVSARPVWHAIQQEDHTALLGFLQRDPSCF